MRVKISPSLLAADFSRLAEEIARVEQGGADMLHLDVMDGHFVPNLTIGPPLVESIRKVSQLFFDVHLMLARPWEFVEPFAKAGADGITIHLEAVPDPRPLLARIASLGKRRGLSINPDTPVDRVAPFLDHIDLLLIMSVFPGFGGQSFIPASLDRLRQARALIRGRPIDLQVDGGVNFENAAAIIEAGATNLVAGTSTFRAGDPAEAIRRLRGEI